MVLRFVRLYAGWYSFAHSHNGGVMLPGVGDVVVGLVRGRNTRLPASDFIH